MILIAGIGNIFLGDDAFGSEAARRMQHLATDKVRIVDFGIRGLDLAYALMDRYEKVIMIDAVSRGGQPGTIYVIEPDLTEIEQAAASVEAHAMDPVRVLALARSMGAELKNIRIVGCEPESLGSEDDGRMGLSLPVSAAVEQAIDVIARMIQEHQETKTLEGAA